MGGNKRKKQQQHQATVEDDEEDDLPVGLAGLLDEFDETHNGGYFDEDDEEEEYEQDYPGYNGAYGHHDDRGRQGYPMSYGGTGQYAQHAQALAAQHAQAAQHGHPATHQVQGQGSGQGLPNRAPLGSAMHELKSLFARGGSDVNGAQGNALHEAALMGKLQELERQKATLEAARNQQQQPRRGRANAQSGRRESPNEQRNGKGKAQAKAHEERGWNAAPAQAYHQQSEDRNFATAWGEAEQGWNTPSNVVTGWGTEQSIWPDQEPREEYTQTSGWDAQPTWPEDEKGKGKGKGKGNQGNQGKGNKGGNEGKGGKKNKGNNQVHVRTAWEQEQEEEERTEVDPMIWGPYPSNTLKMAATEKVTVLDGSVPGKPTAEVRFVESGGAALLPAERALYGRDRHVKDRIRWSFDPTKEEKVSRLLDWIQATSHAVATFGLQKFLESGQRGAIIANAGYRSYMNPQEPAFDWITWPFVVKTLDRTLQQSLAYYDPAAQVLVFVFLLSETGSSIAIWRRRLDVPSSLRITYRKELDRRKAELAKQSLEIITDTPQSTPQIQVQQVAPPKKKKWFRFAD